MLRTVDVGENMILSGKVINLYPTEEQKLYIDKCIELYRHIYNWTIDQYKDHYNLYCEGKIENKCISIKELQTNLGDYRNSNDWLQEVSLATLKNSMFDAVDAFKRFFKNPNKFSFPKYKTKKRSKKQFAPRGNEAFYFEDNMVRIEGLPFGEKIETKWHSGYKKKDKRLFYRIRIHKDKDNQYRLSFCTPIVKPFLQNLSTDDIVLYEYIPSYNRAIGIDLNVKNLIVTSYNSGEIYKAPDISTDIRLLKRYQRKCQKDRNRLNKLKITNSIDKEDLSQYKSKNAIKREQKRNKIYKRIHDKYDTCIRTVAKTIVSRKPKAIVMENLNIKQQMLSKHYIASNLSFYTPFYNTRCIFEWNCTKFDVPFVLAPKDFPSTQKCSKCGHIRNIGSRKKYICPNCGAVMNRDINSAFNLENYYYELI